MLGIARKLKLFVATARPGQLPVGVLARLTCLGKRWFIYVRRGLSRVERNYVLAHEIAEYLLRDEVFTDGDAREYAANVLCLSLLCPTSEFCAAVRTFGRNFAQLGEHFSCPQWVAVLRFGHLHNHPIAVVRRGQIIRTGPWGVVDDSEIWKVVRRRRGARGNLVRLTDVDSPMFAVWFDDDEAA